MPQLESLKIGPGCFQSELDVSLVGMRGLTQFEVGDFSFAQCSKLVLCDLEKLENLTLQPFALYQVRILIVQSKRGAEE